MPYDPPRPVRTYRVSRISQAEILDRPSARRVEFDLAGYWDRSAAEFHQKLRRFHATFLVNPLPMRWVRYRGWRLEEEAPKAERFRVRLGFDIEGVQVALSPGGDVEIVEPRTLRSKVLPGALGIIRRYQD